MPKKLSHALTQLQVKNAKPGRHADGGGLHLLVKETGARSWVFRFMLNGRSRDVGLSRCPEALALLKKSGGEELIGATWDEIDLGKAIWTIPATRMKAGREHRVPLSDRAVEILKSLTPLGQDRIFVGNKGKMSGMAMAMLLRRMGHDATVHGFRSAFRDWSAECTGYPHEVCEMALAHTIENKAEAAYRRGDLFEKRRRLMDDWASFCSGAAIGGANMAPIRSVL